jgi:hypothetical protein
MDTASLFAKHKQFFAPEAQWILAGGGTTGNAATASMRALEGRRTKSVCNWAYRKERPGTVSKSRNGGRDRFTIFHMRFSFDIAEDDPGSHR